MKYIRKLEKKDAPLMLEWMHDIEIVKNFSVRFNEYTANDVKKFIEESFNDYNRHFAIINEKDEYLGTISLKNISKEDKNAEYAVVCRKCAQGTGISQQATREILAYAFDELGLERVYLNVLEENIRACKFYEKVGFKKEGVFQRHKNIQGRLQNLCWYGMLKDTLRVEEEYESI